MHVINAINVRMYACMDGWMYGCMDVCMDGWMDVSRSEIQLPPQNPVGLDSTRRLVHQQKVSIFIGPKAGCNPWLHGFLFLDQQINISLWGRRLPVSWGGCYRGLV